LHLPKNYAYIVVVLRVSSATNLAMARCEGMYPLRAVTLEPLAVTRCRRQRRFGPPHVAILVESLQRFMLAGREQIE
jgi:hypothetical protein